ncbi:MAG: hemin uptake protein HemP [Aquabacterium sp.]
MLKSPLLAGAVLAAEAQAATPPCANPASPALAQASMMQTSKASASTPVNRCWRSDDLLAGASAVLIEHQGQVYQLRATKQGKLILTK